jgi:hypothetical protein
VVGRADALLHPLTTVTHLRLSQNRISSTHADIEHGK